MSRIDKIRRPGRLVFFKDPDSAGQVLDDPGIERAGEAATQWEAVEERLGRLLKAMDSVLAGDFTARMPEGEDDLVGQIGRKFNAVAALNEDVAKEMSQSQS